MTSADQIMAIFRNHVREKMIAEVLYLQPGGVSEAELDEYYRFVDENKTQPVILDAKTSLLSLECFQDETVDQFSLKVLQSTDNEMSLDPDQWQDELSGYVHDHRDQFIEVLASIAAHFKAQRTSN